MKQNNQSPLRRFVDMPNEDKEKILTHAAEKASEEQKTIIKKAKMMEKKSTETG